MDESLNLTDQDAALLWGLIASLGLVLLIVCLIFYLVDAIGRFKYLKVRGHQSPWMAFIPILNIYATIEATYGKVDKIKLFGAELPAKLVQLYPLILAIISGVASNIKAISTPVSSIVYILNLAIAVIVFRDMLARLDKEVSIGFSVIANLIPIVAAIKLITSCKGLSVGQYNYMTDTRPLPSQEAPNVSNTPQ